MAKTQLVVLCDGTWNDPAASTNVWLTYLAICDRLKRLPGDETGPWDEKIGLDRRVSRRLGDDGATVITQYDSGVGTEKGHKLSGGGLGLGLSENVRQAYEFLVDNYVDGAEIFVFGFSRGAYTVRSLCGFIKAIGGLLSKESLAGSRDQILLDAYDLYRTKPEQRAQSPLRAQIDALKPRPITIRCLGVYDTVGALGVPIPAFSIIGNLFFRGVARFHDTVLSNIVENAFQALAIDERRGPFVPALWTAAPRLTGSAVRATTRRTACSACCRCGSPARTRMSAAATRTGHSPISRWAGCCAARSKPDSNCPTARCRRAIA